MYGMHPELTRQIAADQACEWRGTAARRRRIRRATPLSRRPWLATFLVR